jgi:rsbT antagonist protein RsbS
MHNTEIDEAVVQSFNSIGNCLIATLQPDVDEAYLRQLGGDISNALKGGDYRSLILDATPLELIDASDFERLRRVIKTVGLMGVGTVVVGLKPGVVASLVELNANVDGLVTTLNMEKALEIAGQSELIP